VSFGPEPPRAGQAAARPGRIPATTFSWAILGINVVVWLLMELVGSSTSGRTLVAFGAKVNPLIAQGEYWRLFTPIFLHIGLTHLLFNGFAILSFGRLAEIVYGHGRFLAIYLVSGVTGALLSYLMSRGLSAGASGAIFGIAGALAVFYAQNRSVPHVAGQGQLIGIVLILVINGVYGLANQGVDNWGHLGGLLGGLSMAMWLTPKVAAVQDLDGDGDAVALRWRSSSPASWLIVPVLVAIVILAVATIPGAQSVPLTLPRPD
jgi:rhomboid protease GluP